MRIHQWVGSVVVVVTEADGLVLGIFSERDVVRVLASGVATLDDSVSSHLTSRVLTATEDAGVPQIMERKTEGRFRHVTVVEGGR